MVAGPLPARAPRRRIPRGRLRLAGPGEKSACWGKGLVRFVVSVLVGMARSTKAGTQIEEQGNLNQGDRMAALRVVFVLGGLLVLFAGTAAAQTDACRVDRSWVRVSPARSTFRTILRWRQPLRVQSDGRGCYVFLCAGRSMNLNGFRASRITGTSQVADRARTRRRDPTGRRHPRLTLPVTVTTRVRRARTTAFRCRHSSTIWGRSFRRSDRLAMGAALPSFRQVESSSRSGVATAALAIRGVAALRSGTGIFREADRYAACLVSHLVLGE